MSEKKAADATTLAVIRDWIKGLFYQKPSSGIPKTDLASGVQSSLDKADSALQSHQSLADYVKGPSSSVDARVAVFNGTGGKTLKDSGFTIGKSVPSDAKFTDSDTKNTAGSTDTNSKIFLIGATTQAANPQTYSQDTAYVGTDGHLYSNGAKVLNVNDELVKYDDSELGSVVLTNADRLNGYASSDFQMALTFDSTPTANSNNPVKSGGIYTALAGKQNTLTFDNVPTANSNNPVKSGGVYTKVSELLNSTLKPFISSVAEGLRGAWHIKVYSDFSTTPTLDDCKSRAQIIQGVVVGSSAALDRWEPFGLAENFVAWYRAYVYASSTTTFTDTLTTDDKAKFYINESLVATTTAANSAVSFTTTVNAGWNVFDIVYEEGTGNSGWYFGSFKDFNTLSWVTYAGPIQFDISMLS